MQSLYLGIDTGTQGVRTAVCDSAGNVISSVERKWDTAYPQKGYAEQDPSDWINNITEALTETFSGLTPEEKMNIKAGTVCATSSTTIPVTKDGKPLMPAFMWMDARAAAQAEKINSTNHPALSYCGGAVAFEWLVPKLLWLKEEKADVYKACDLFVEQLDFINYHLTGIWCGAKCNAVCKWNYSDSLGGFSDDYFQRIGLPDYRDKMLTGIRRMGEKIGKIRPELADKYGLSHDMEIIQGGVDAHVALYGMNAFSPGRMGIIMGTSFVHLSQVNVRPENISGIWGPYENALEDGLYVLEGGQITASGLVNWFHENFHTPVTDGNPYKALSEASEEVSPGAEGLTALDFFQGNRTPYKDARAKGVFYGLNIRHTWKHMYRALLESISFGTRNIIDNQENQGYGVELIAGCGGVTKDRQWMQMISDITGKSIVVNEESQAGVMGCVIAAAVGSGGFSSFREAADSIVRVKEKYTPDMKTHAMYEEPYKKYLALYQNLKGMMAED